MSGFEDRPKGKNQRQDTQDGTSRCMRVERNSDGIPYFRQPRGHNDFVTWHIQPAGEAMLRQNHIEDGMCLPPVLLKKLRIYCQLFTLDGKPSSAPTCVPNIIHKKEQERASGGGPMSGRVITVLLPHAERVPKPERKKGQQPKFSRRSDLARQATPSVKKGRAGRQHQQPHPQAKQSPESRLHPGWSKRTTGTHAEASAAPSDPEQRSRDQGD